MTLHRVQFTIRRMMVGVALSGVILAWASDRARSGHPLVVFEYRHVIENEPLVNPTKLLAIEGGCFLLEDGRVVRIDAGPYLEAMIGFEDSSRGKCVLDVATAAGGAVTIHTLQPTWYCGNCSRRRLLPLRIALFPRNVYRNYRALVGTGKVVRVSATAGL